MGKYDKIYEKIMSGKVDANIKFLDLVGLVCRLNGINQHPLNGGDHFVYNVDGQPERIVLQPDKRDHSKAKSYQVKQVRNIIIKYNLEVRK